MSEIPTVNIIGLGQMGECHVQAVTELGWKITAICDKSRDRLKQIADKFHIDKTRCYANGEEMLLKAPPPMLLIIATTADSHCYYTCLGAQRGIDFILCEKPMATSLSDCDKMIEACRTSGSILSINHQMRFMTQYTLVKEYIQNKQFGSLASMNIIGGCFGVAMNGSHYIEAFAYLSNDRPSEVMAWFSDNSLPNPRGKQFTDKAGQLRILSESGLRMNLEIGPDQGHGMTVVYATRYGHIFVDELSGELHAVVRKKEYQEYPLTRYGLPCDRWSYQFTPLDNTGCTKHVLTALLEKKNYPSGADGKMVVNTLVAAYYSAQHYNARILLGAAELPYNHYFTWA